MNVVSKLAEMMGKTVFKFVLTTGFIVMNLRKSVLIDTLACKITPDPCLKHNHFVNMSLVISLKELENDESTYQIRTFHLSSILFS